MNIAKYIIVVAISIAVAFIFSCSEGSNGASGADGINGANGIDGTDCAIEATSGEEIASGEYKITCDGVAIGYLSNGADGLPGATGADGVPGAAGLDGADGTSCVVEDLKIICGEVVVGYLRNGIDGLPGANGTDGVAGTDGSKGGQGLNGEDGADGVDGDSCYAVDVWTHIEVRCGDKPPEIVQKVEWCDVVPYNPAIQFCAGGIVYRKCADTVVYNPVTHVCYNNELFLSCGNLPYDPETHSCYNNQLYSCNNLPYNPAKHFCYDNQLYFYDSTTQLYDIRDGKIYKKVTIGTQTWMAENLNYDVQNNITDVCYNNIPNNCDIYGRMYDWATAMNISTTYNSSNYTASANHQGICPDGWHMPSDAEWTTLTNSVGSSAGTKLKAVDYWSLNSGYIAGTNSYNFSALPGGIYNGSFADISLSSYWWSSTGYNASNAYVRYVVYNNANVNRNYYSKAYRYYVRCLLN